MNIDKVGNNSSNYNNNRLPSSYRNTPKLPETVKEELYLSNLTEKYEDLEQFSLQQNTMYKANRKSDIFEGNENFKNTTGTNYNNFITTEELKNPDTNRF